MAALTLDVAGKILDAALAKGVERKLKPLTGIEAAALKANAD